MRGYGDSDKPNGIKNYSMQNLIKDVRETIEKLGQSSTILVAHDWGAVVAWYFAMYHPDMVERLVICNVPHPKAFEKVLRSKAAQFLKSWYIFLFQCPILPEEWIKTQDYKAIEIFFRGRKMGIVNRENFTDEDTEAWKFTFSTNGLTAPINYYRALMQLPERLRPTKEPVKPKTLILWGENDGALDIEGANLSPNYCENAQLKKIPDCSHWVQQDCPELVNKYIEEFLNEH
uniref:AB hydrolase-1 domain-containing protein n=1 Tax=Acrobeloides nanus TaxID=290746 RepID=A0A914CXI6_9BILA